VDRGTRIYYLTTWILKDLFENVGKNNEDNNDYSEVITNFVNPEEIKNLHSTKSFG